MGHMMSLRGAPPRSSRTGCPRRRGSSCLGWADGEEIGKRHACGNEIIEVECDWSYFRLSFSL